MKLLRALTVLLISGAANAQGTPYVWYEGDVRHEIHAQPGVVAEFGAADLTPNGGGLQKLSGTTLVKRSGTTKIFRLNSTAIQKLSSTAQASGQSPVFAESASGGTMRALPGGIIVTFKKVRDEAWIRTWAVENGLEFSKILPSTQKTLAVFKTASGLVALDTANQVRVLPDVLSAEPNWWTEKWKGSLEPKALSPSEAKRDQAARKAMGRRFVEP